MRDFHVKDYVIRAGKFVCASPSVTHRIPELFPEPDRFDPDRYSPGRAEDKDLFGWQAFGGGRHKCSGNAFALFQIKAIFCVLLRRYAFELVGAPDSYRDDYRKMVVEPASPCLVRYRRRQDSRLKKAAKSPASIRKDTVAAHFRIIVDRELCKGHAHCMGEAPEIFRVDEKGRLEVLDERPAAALIEKAKAAEKYCPNRAISLVDDSKP
jgi:sterol 14-demethylase